MFILYILAGIMILLTIVALLWVLIYIYIVIKHPQKMNEFYYKAYLPCNRDRGY